ncbi:hypothetical protein [Piscinibacter koreensis]|uniref:Uncharacterized protein n=1 Tax=Piscinibacter koreensis TaxID=2742824 RepID=A0A7Y6TY11_9BURK|nr:hypothetical protein [Schlegelella koreensis]NUZ07611.1 hypothetical protein [Schlegelella koreensis]
MMMNGVSKADMIGGKVLLFSSRGGALLRELPEALTFEPGPGGSPHVNLPAEYCRAASTTWFQAIDRNGHVRFEGPTNTAW